MWSNLQTILQRRPLYQLCFSSALQKSSTSHEMYVEPLNPSPGKTNRKCMKMLRITEYSCIAMTQSIRKIMACRTVIAHSKPPCVKPFQHHHWNMSAKVTFAFPSFPTDSPRFLAGWWYTYPSEKWWSSSVGMMTFHSQNDGKVIKFHGSKAPTSHQSPQIHTNSPRCLGCPILKWPSPWQGTLCHNQGAVLGLFGTCLARWTLVVPLLFSGGIMDVLWMFYGCFMDVLWMCSW